MLWNHWRLFYWLSLSTGPLGYSLCSMVIEIHFFPGENKVYWAIFFDQIFLTRGHPGECDKVEWDCPSYLFPNIDQRLLPSQLPVIFQGVDCAGGLVNLSPNTEGATWIQTLGGDAQSLYSTGAQERQVEMTKRQMPLLKMCHRLEQTFPQRRWTDGQQAPQKMLSKCTSKSPWDTTSYSLRWL